MRSFVMTGGEFQMSASRRVVVQGLTAFSTLTAGSCEAAAPRGAISLADYGGGKGDPVEDTVAVRRCVQDAAGEGRPWTVPRGTWALCPHHQDTLFRHGPFDVLPCIEVDAPTQCVGLGGRFVIARGPSYPQLANGARTAMFLIREGRTQERRAATIFQNVIFDFDQNYSNDVQLPYAMEINGISNLFIENCTFENRSYTGTMERRGWCISIINCSDININNNKFENINQGLNARYVSGIKLNDNKARAVFELFDFDGVVNNLESRRCELRAKPRSGSQMYDLSAASDVLISDIYCEGVDSVVSICDKPTTSTTYDLYAANAPAPKVPNYPTSRNIVVRRLKSISSAGGLPIRVGIDRLPSVKPGQDTTGRPSPMEIIFDGVELQDAGAVRITEGDVVLKDVTIQSALVRDVAANPAAIYAVKNHRTPRIAHDTSLRLTLDSVSISGGAGRAIIVRRADELVMKDIAVNGVWHIAEWQRLSPGKIFAVP